VIALLVGAAWPTVTDTFSTSTTMVADDGLTRVAGIEIPSVDPVFLTLVGIHVVLGLVVIVAGAVAMLSSKRAGRHPTAGSIYFWALAALAATATALAFVRWAEDYHLFILGTLAFGAALLGRRARRRLWSHWAQYHILGMGLSYVFVLTAFYVDNGKSLPLWNRLPAIAYWLLPAAVGIPFIVHALLRHPLARSRRGPA
jgi:FtsH-binding integral membrane protein